jgi:hypothetical protein
MYPEMSVKEVFNKESESVNNMGTSCSKEKLFSSINRYSRVGTGNFDNDWY